MPEQVDHEARRREIIEALFRVAARDGLAAATYRTIAADADISAPQVQYYFATKADLIQAALFELGRRVVGRGLDLMARAGPNPSPEVMLRAAVEGSHPVDDATRQDLILFYLFFVAAIADGSIADGVVNSQRFIAESFADWIRTAQERGDVAPELDPVHEARFVLFANAGLILAALVGVHTVEDAKASMDYHLTKLFGVGR